MKKKLQQKQIANYILFQKIGQGSTAEVYQAYNVKTKKYAAVKVLSFKKINIEQMNNLLKNELTLLNTFSHDNIIKIKSLSKTPNNLYVILEYCNGNTLNRYRTDYYLKYQSQLPEVIVQKILKQVIQGLYFIHQNKCVHRDIKLDNILLNFTNIPNIFLPNSKPIDIPFERRYSVDEPFTIKIADLGFATALNERNLASTICGTPITMAPDVFNWTEHINQSHSYNEKADLWSLGAITYELLIGKSPFFAHEQQKLFQLVKEGKYTIPKDMTLSLEAISFINGLLQFYPDKRMDWPQILNHPFITKDYTELHLINLNTVKQPKGNDNDIEFNVKERNDFEWLLPNISSLDYQLESNINNKDQPIENINTINVNEQPSVTKEIKRNNENEELLNLMVEENKQLKKMINELKSSQNRSNINEIEKDELKAQIRIKTEENERLLKEIQTLQNTIENCLIIKDNYYNTVSSSNCNDRISFDWEIINNSNKDNVKNTDITKPNLDLQISTNICNSNNINASNSNIANSKLFDIINDFFN